ncbi:hypothetical protein FRB94_007691 [Tulasnella sp. JGI-2019a]|nr:hypothetical protein FRB94_007691 [Tulasnella sp. JGI-2019a]
MGQVWRILNFDSKQTYSGGAKLGELFFKFSAEVLVSDLRVPDKVSFDEIMKVTRNAYDTKPTDCTNSETQLPEGVPLLTNLPVEIIKMSFKSIDKLQDAISLGLTCKRLLEIGLDQINRILAVSAGRWAGGRIACIGGYEGNRDMPNHVLTPEEQAILEDRDISLYEYGDSFEEVYGRCLPQCDSDFSRRLSQVERRQYRAIVGAAGDLFETAVLCNLSKREYVRQEAVEGFGSVGLGTFLLSRICWSEDSSVSMEFRDICDGDWAGDRFEITTINALKDGADTWEDVSEGMAGLMEKIWEREYGEDWPNECH